MTKISIKIIMISVIFCSIFISKAAWSISLNSFEIKESIILTETLRGVIPFSNIKVYKRWNEEDISWKAWFRRGAAILTAFLVSSFGVIILLFVNNIRLQRLVKKNYQGLWEAEENYYRLLEIVNDAVMLLDPVSKNVFGVNQSMEALTGFQRIDLLDMNIYSLTLKSEEKETRQLFKRIEDENYIVNATLNILNRDKKVISTAVKGRLIKGYTKTVLLLTLSESNNT